MQLPPLVSLSPTYGSTADVTILHPIFYAPAKIKHNKQLWTSVGRHRSRPLTMSANDHFWWLHSATTCCCARRSFVATSSQSGRAPRVGFAETWRRPAWWGRQFWWRSLAGCPTSGWSCTRWIHWGVSGPTTRTWKIHSLLNCSCLTPKLCLSSYWLVHRLLVLCTNSVILWQPIKFIRIS